MKGVTEMTPVAVISIVAALILATALLLSEMGRKRLKSELVSEKLRSEIDPMTRLYNNRGLNHQVEVIIAQAERHERPVSLMMIDCDGFKLINDTHGHQAGDKALKNLANLLASGTRKGDIVARRGGDEFAIILPETDKASALIVAEEISKAVADHEFPVNGHSVKFTVSIGIANYSEDALNYLDLEDMADQAMYYSKDKGGNCVTDAATLEL